MRDDQRQSMNRVVLAQGTALSFNAPGQWVDIRSDLLFSTPVSVGIGQRPPLSDALVTHERRTIMAADPHWDAQCERARRYIDYLRRRRHAHQLARLAWRRAVAGW